MARTKPLIAAGDDHLTMMRAIRDRLLEAIMSEECPIRQVSPLSRRIEDIVDEVATLEEGTTEALKSQLDVLKRLRARVLGEVNDPNCDYREISPLTRRIQSLAKVITSVEERLRQQGDGDGGTDDNDSGQTGPESFDPSSI